MGEPASGDFLQIAEFPQTQVDESQNVAGLRQPSLITGAFEHLQGPLRLAPNCIQGHRVRAGGKTDPGPFETDGVFELTVPASADFLEQLRKNVVGICMPAHHLVRLSEVSRQLPPERQRTRIDRHSGLLPPPLTPITSSNRLAIRNTVASDALIRECRRRRAGEMRAHSGLGRRWPATRGGERHRAYFEAGRFRHHPRRPGGTQ